MIPVIGLMLGGYIITRCLDVLDRKEWQPSVVSTAAFLNMFLTAVCVWYLFHAASELEEAVQRIPAWP